MQNTFLETPYFAFLIVVFFIAPVWILIIFKVIFPFFSRREENQRLKQNQTERSLAVCSYAREDKGYAEVIKRIYKDAGIKLVIDEDDLLVGEKWKDVIDEYIDKSESFVYCLSTNAKKSANVKRELEVALNLNKERVQFIKPYRWNKKVTIPEEIADIHIEYIKIKVRDNEDGTKTYYRDYSVTLESAKAMKSSTIAGLLFLIFIIPTLAFWGIRELQKVFFTDDIKYEELYKQVPPIEIEDNKFETNWDLENSEENSTNIFPKTEIKKLPPKKSLNLIIKPSRTPSPSKRRIQQQSPSLTTITSDVPTQLDCPQTNNAVILENSKVSNPGERASIIDFSVVGKKEHKAGELVMLYINVENAEEIKLTPEITKLTYIERNIYDTEFPLGHTFISITPDKTRDYLLEVTGKDRITVCKKTTVYITPNKIESISSKSRPQIIKFKIQALPPRNLKKILSFSDESILKKTKREDLTTFSPLGYHRNGYICFHVANAKLAVISGFGQIEVGKEQCILIPKRTTELELTVFGFGGRIIRRRIEYDLKSEGPEFKLISKQQLSSTKDETSYKFCFQSKNVKYIVLVTDKQKSQLLYLTPPDEKKICVIKKIIGNPKYLLILGTNGESYPSMRPWYDLNY